MKSDARRSICFKGDENGEMWMILVRWFGVRVDLTEAEIFKRWTVEVAK